MNMSPDACLAVPQTGADTGVYLPVSNMYYFVHESNTHVK